MSVPSRPLAGLLVLGLAASTPLLAQAPEAPPPDAEPTGEPKAPESWAAESRPVAVARTPGQVRVFDADDIHRSGARTLGEFLLRELPAQVQNQGGPGLPSRAYLGGSRPQDTLILVDGLPRMDPGRLGQDLNEVPLLGITRIEVLLGTPGVGPSGQGATIALYTGQPLTSGLSGDLSGLGGSRGQGQSTVAPGYAWAGGYLQGGNLLAEEKQTTDTVRPFRMVTNFLDLGQRVGPTLWRLSWRSTAFGVPEPYQVVTDTTRTYDPARESWQRSEGGQLRMDWGLRPGILLETSLGLVRFRHGQPRAGVSEPSPFEGRQTRFQSALLVRTGLRSDLSVRLEAQDTQQHGDEDPAVQGSAEGRSLAFGLEWRFEPRPGLRLVGQARLTRDRQSLLQGSGNTDVLDAGGHTLRLAANQELPYGFRLYASADAGRTAPALLQQLRNTRDPAAAPLRMEQRTTLQVGLGWGQGRWYGKFESQQQSGRDLIGFNGQAYVNQDRLRVRGTEGALGWRTGTTSGVEGFLRVQEARDLQVPEAQGFSTPAAQRRPFNAHGLRGFLGWRQVRAEVHYTLQGHQYAAAGDSEAGGRAANGLPAAIRPTRVVYREVGFSTSLQAGPHWSFVLRGEHLLQPTTDADAWTRGTLAGQNDASLIDGFPAARPSYSLEARYRF